MPDADLFFEKYGPLITLNELAQLLRRSPEGLRISLRNTSPFSAAVNATRIRLGRRVYFSTPKLANLLGLRAPEEMSDEPILKNKGKENSPGRRR